MSAAIRELYQLWKVRPSRHCEAAKRLAEAIQTLTWQQSRHPGWIAAPRKQRGARKDEHHLKTLHTETSSLLGAAA